MVAQEVLFDKIEEALVLSKDGVWFSNGQEITHQNTVKAFFRGLTKIDDQYFIKLGTNVKSVKVEDLPLFVTSIDWNKDWVLLHLSNEKKESLQFETLEYSEGRLVCKTSGGKARFKRAPYHEFLSACSDRQGRVVLDLGVREIEMPFKMES